MKISFPAQIKDYNKKALVSGDDSLRLTLEANLIDTPTKCKILELSDTDKNRSQELLITITDEI